MFPSSPKASEEEILWNIDGLKESLQSPETNFRKVCTSDGILLGFAGWTIDKGYKNNSGILKGNNKEHPVELKPRKVKNIRAKLPGSLDVDAWATATKKFATEKQRVLQSLGMVWRKSILTF